MAIEELLTAIEDGDEEALAALLADNDPNCLGEEGKGPVHKAVEGEVGCLNRLIAHAGIDLNLKDSEGSTALIAAAMYGDLDCVKALVEAGADKDAANEAGKTAVAIAEEEGNNDIIGLLGGTLVEEVERAAPTGPPRRNSVSSESVDPNAKLDVTQLPQNEKSPEESARIKGIIEGNFLFKALDAKTLQVVINSMTEVTHPEGAIVIKQGDEGDFFYVVESGTLDCYVQKDKALWLMQKAQENPDGDKGVKVLDYSPGQTFGELALMYNTPRAATLVATSQCALLAMERVIFRSIVMGSLVARREKSEATLQACALLATLDANTRAAIADTCASHHYEEGECVLEQGVEAGAPRLFFVARGSVTASFRGPRGEQVPRASYDAVGAFFGAREALRRAPPALSYVAATEAECFAIDAADVKRLLLVHPAVADALQAAAAEDDAADAAGAAAADASFKELSPSAPAPAPAAPAAAAPAPPPDAAPEPPAAKAAPASEADLDAAAALIQAAAATAADAPAPPAASAPAPAPPAEPAEPVKPPAEPEPAPAKKSGICALL